MLEKKGKREVSEPFPHFSSSRGSLIGFGSKSCFGFRNAASQFREGCPK